MDATVVIHYVCCVELAEDALDGHGLGQGLDAGKRQQEENAQLAVDGIIYTVV